MFVSLLDIDHDFHHLVPNGKHILIFVFLYHHNIHGTRERALARTFTDFYKDIPSLSSAEVCLEYYGRNSSGVRQWVKDWDFRTAESDIEDLLTKGTKLTERTLSLLGT